MKHILRLTIILFTTQFTKAQIVFCPPGAEWHYTYFWGFPYKIENEKIQYVRDTTLGNVTSKVLAHRKFFKSYNPPANNLTLIRQIGDTVFFRNEVTQHAWQILYNYAALPGQSWQTTVEQTDPNNPQSSLTYTVIVDSVKFITINGFNLKTLFVTYSFWDGVFGMNNESVQITERLGAHSFLFPFDNYTSISDYDEVNAFLCYQDNAFGLKQFTNKPCDYSDYTGLGEITTLSDLEVYPNPSHGLFHVTDLNTIAGRLTLSVTDITSREVKRLELEQGLEEYTIDLKDLANGTYLATLKSDNTPVYTAKLIKQD